MTWTWIIPAAVTVVAIVGLCWALLQTVGESPGLATGKAFLWGAIAFVAIRISWAIWAAVA